MSVKTRGFASLSPEKRREIARKGGKAAHEYGLAHKWTKEEATEAGKIGGATTSERRKRKEQENAGNNTENIG